MARLFGSSDVDGAIRVACLLLVPAMDPLSPPQSIYHGADGNLPATAHIPDG